jgi:hypothetical protein
MSAFAAAVDALFADPSIATAAIYTPDGGIATPIRVVLRRPDSVTDFGGAQVWSETTRVDLRVSDVASPRPGDTLAIGGEMFVIQGEPVRDRERLVWTVDLRPA